jgi:DNA polymerase-3 subunit alpha
MNNYVPYHVHTEMSLLDSCTNYKDYVDFCVDNNIKAICFTEHGNIYRHFEKRQYCKEKGIKYLHGCEVYLTKQLEPKLRDNYHTILIAKDMEGFRELNSLIGISTDKEHFYYNPRLSFEEFFNISDHIFKISACLKSPLADKENIEDYIYDKLCKKYDYYEIQYHNDPEHLQYNYNRYLLSLSQKYNKPLIAAGDSHSVSNYKAECRQILLKAKRKSYGNEDDFDLVIKNYNDFLKSFQNQNALSNNIILEAINNTNIMANQCEEIVDDYSIKYPIVSNNDEKDLQILINKKYKEKLDKKIISNDHKYIDEIREEFRVFKKTNMLGFMLGMAQISEWCEENNIPRGFGRGSCCGSVIAYIIDIIDVDPIKWNTIFSRFCNEYRTEVGDIDLDFAPNDREKVYNYIIDRFGKDKTAYILSIGTISEKGTIDEIGRALDIPLNEVKEIKELYSSSPEEARNKYPKLFYYFNGLLDTAISQGFHPAGIVASPITLPDNYGVFQDRDNKTILNLDMEEVHSCGLVKYDILGLKNVGIIQDVYKMINKPYPKSYQINWNDKNIWKDIKTSPVGIFQFESSFAYSSMKTFDVNSIDDLTLVNACIRPSGTSYRDAVFAHQRHKNPSELIDKVLSNSYGRLVYQEQTIAFLQQACGLSGGEADNVRRAIGRKQKDRLDKAMPQILEGYCSNSDKPRKEAEKEVKEFLQVIEDSASYQFGFNHATAYSMIGYLCAYLRYYYPAQFITAFLNSAANDEDIKNGTDLANLKNIKIISPKFRHSTNNYSCDNNIIYKGTSSIKGLSKIVGDKLYKLKDNTYNTFLDLLIDCKNNGIGVSDITTLAKLDYFSEFGKINKILKFINIYNELYGKKIIKKDKEYTVKLLFLKQYCSKETEKQYSGFDSYKCLLELWDKIEDKDISFNEKISYQLQYYGYLDIIDRNIDSNIWVVLFYEDRGRNKIVDLYRLNNGEKVKIKVKGNVFNSNPFNIGDFLQIPYFDREGKWFLNSDTNKWEKSLTTFENILNTYKIIDRGEI